MKPTQADLDSMWCYGTTGQVGDGQSWWPVITCHMGRRRRGFVSQGHWRFSRLWYIFLWEGENRCDSQGKGQHSTLFNFLCHFHQIYNQTSTVLGQSSWENKIAEVNKWQTRELFVDVIINRGRYRWAHTVIILVFILRYDSAHVWMGKRIYKTWCHKVKL